MDKAADYLREWSNRYKQHGHYARMEEWSGGQAQYHLANFAGRMASGSTPSPDPPPCSNCANLETALAEARADKNRWEDHFDEACRLGGIVKTGKEDAEKTCERLREALRERELERDSYKFLRDCTRLSLERVLHNFELLLAQKPVRDADETISEARAALAPSLPTKEK